MRQHGEWAGWRSVMAAVMLAAAFGPAAVEAAPVNFSLVGKVTFADDGNEFGLSAGDSVSLTGTYDDSLYDGVGFKNLSFGAGTGNTLQVTLGSVVLNEFNDIDFDGGNFPAIMFFEGAVVGTDIITEIGENGSPVDFGSNTQFEGFDVNGLSIAGRWEVAAIQNSVPEPGSLALAGTAALAGALFVRRRKSSTTTTTRHAS